MIGAKKEIDWISSGISNGCQAVDICWSQIKEASLSEFGLREQPDDLLIYRSREFVLLGWKVSPSIACHARRTGRSLKIQIMNANVDSIDDLSSWFSLTGIIEICPLGTGISITQHLRVSLARQGPLKYLPRHGIEIILMGMARAIDARVSRAIRRRLVSQLSGRHCAKLGE